MHRKVLQNAHFKNKFALQTDYEIGQSDRFETAPPNQKRGWNEMNILIILKSIVCYAGLVNLIFVIFRFREPIFRIG